MSQPANAEPAPPLQPGQRLTVTVGDVAFGGEGVARVAGFVVFVPFAAPDEEVEVEVVEVKKNFARARLVRVARPSPHRVEPRCRYFGVCGGCQYQHLDYAEQLRLKHRQLRDLLERLGGLDASVVAPVVPCPQPYGYRNRIMVRTQWHKPEQRRVLGFLRHDSRLVVDVEECAIAEPALNAQLRRVRAAPPPRGGLKVVLRLPPAGWELPPDSFFQNNFHLLPALVETLRARLRAAGTRHLVDVFCGVGFFALELADLVESFAGVELDRRAIAAARRNAAARGVRHGEFVEGAAEEQLPALLGRFVPEHTTVIVDPPRVGCAPAVRAALRACRPAQILYVSCHPATLARDLQELVREGGYRVETVIPLDMFPQTQHLECVADLRQTGQLSSTGITPER
jgi:tRNA/tmRNA/rRNA uracil-C5-methylase (TrmA/RlmC/RlmD family)